MTWVRGGPFRDGVGCSHRRLLKSLHLCGSGLEERESFQHSCPSPEDWGLLESPNLSGQLSSLLPPGKPQLLPPLQGSGFTSGFYTSMPLFCQTKRPDRSPDKLLCLWIDSTGDKHVEKEENS